MCFLPRRAYPACPAGNYSGAVATSCPVCPTGSSSVAGSSTCTCNGGYASSGIAGGLTCNSKCNACDASMNQPSFLTGLRLYLRAYQFAARTRTATPVTRRARPAHLAPPAALAPPCVPVRPAMPSTEQPARVRGRRSDLVSRIAVPALSVVYPWHLTGPVLHSHGGCTACAPGTYSATGAPCASKAHHRQPVTRMVTVG